MGAATYRRVIAALLAVLLLGMMIPVSASDDEINTTSDIFQTGHLLLESGEIHTQTFEARAGWYWIEALCDDDCQNLEMKLTDSSEIIHSATVTSSAHLQGQLPSGSTTISLENSGNEDILLHFQASLPELNSISEIDSQENKDHSTLIEFSSSEDKADILLQNPQQLSDPAASWINATLESAGEVYWPFEAKDGDLLELVLLYSSDELNLKILANDSEFSTVTEISTHSNTSVFSPEQRVWVGLEEGEYWLVANSTHEEVSFTARLAHHLGTSDTENGDWPGPGEENIVQELDDDETIQKTGIIGSLDIDVLIINASGRDAWTIEFSSSAEMNVYCEALIDGIWVSITRHIEAQQKIDGKKKFEFWSEESTGLFRFTITSNESLLWGLEASRVVYRDYGVDSDALGSIPWNQTDALENFVTLELEEGSSFSGWLNTAIYDGRDTYLVNLVGWEDSRFRVRIKLTSDNQLVNADILEMNWADRSVISNSTTPANSDQEVETSLEMGPGIHLIRINSIVITDFAANWTWGDYNQTPIQWTIQVEAIQTEEGERPWFEAEDFVFDVSQALLWLLGLMMVAPMILVLWNSKRQTRQAQRLAADRERLVILRELLAKGEIKQARIDLKTSLRTIASLDWETGVKTWGQPDLRHRTENLELVVWKLPKKISKNNATPILVGVNIFSGNWEVSALRFEASSGQAWKIVNCQPKLLFRDDELFLDSLGEGSRTFVQVELSGDGEGLEISLTGLIGGEPNAAKPSKSLSLEEE